MTNPLWTIGVVALKRRKEFSLQLRALLSGMAPEGGPLELLWHEYNEQDPTTIGERRQMILSLAKGDYISFVDDDDYVEPRLISNIAAKMQEGERPDCFGILGIFANWTDRDFNNMHLFMHSIRIPSWGVTDKGLRVRSPNHINPVRREIALKVGFHPISYGEDRAYSQELKPFLKHELFIPEVYYYYRKNYEQYRRDNV